MPTFEKEIGLQEKRAFSATTTPQIGFYSGYFPQLAAVVQPLLLGALQSLTTVLLKTAANCLQRFLYNNRCKIPFTAVFN
jgi:hypothetical protein